MTNSRKQEADLIIKKLASHGLEALWAHNKGGGFWIRGGKYLSKAQAKKLADSRLLNRPDYRA